REGGQIAVQELSFTPLTKMHYIDSEGMLGSNLPGGGSSVRFTHIVIFAFAGLMVILCTLFNYLSLFISRFRIRRKEFALRTVCGSSGWSLFLLLATELVITLILSIVVEMCIVNYVLHPFQELSAVKMGLSEIYPETISYISVVMSILLLVFGLTVSILRRRSLNLAIRRRNNSLFRKISVVMQLIISIGFAFCTIVIIKQIYFLHNSADLGFSFKNRGSVLFYSKEADETEFLNRVKAIPEVNEALIGTAILPYSMIMTVGISDWEGKTEDQETVTLYKEDITNEYYRFYELRLVSGEMAKETSKGMNSVSTVRGTNLQSMSSGTEEDTEVLINETAAKAFGWDEPIGKTFNGQKVVGVIKDVCKLSPSIPVRPTYYQVAPQTPTTRWDDGTLRVSVIFKFREGSWDVVRKHIADIIATEYPDTQYSEISDTHEAYDHHLKSETSLLILLEFISGVCILICIFGFVSVVSLSCEERRKEIAIRKINGATLLDILNIFFRENFLLLLIGAVIAFPAGYYIMRGWLDKYIRQTPLEAWLYIAIFLSMALLIVLCVGYRVWRESVENPAEVVKEN
ncbi:MAG: FtsX-like permease family protein, partial [Tannerella sp.]|nr:FtsX-like permease family protein [Tannerella sp.]